MTIAPSPRTLHRRVLLRTALAGAATATAGAVLAACGSEPAPTAAPAPTTRPTTAPMTAATTAPMAAATTTTPTTAPVATTAATTAPMAATTAPMAAAPAATTSGMTAAPAGTASSGAAGHAGMGPMSDGLIPSPRPDLGVADAYTKLPPRFKSSAMVPGKASRWTAFIISYEPPHTPKPQNQFWQELEKRLGVSNYEPTVAPNADYEAKFSTMLASGDLPDTVFFSPPSGWQRVLLQGAFTDLTPYLTGDALKEYPNLAKFPAQVWKNVALNKKIYGVPHLREIARDGFYFRQDWAEKLGFATQKNADDVYNMFVGMTKNDPDGNGRADTFGLSASSPRPQLAVNSFRQMFRAPNQWRQNPDGTLTHTLETPEYRQTLEFARRLWAGGAYHPDALTASTSQNKDLLAGGKVGAYSDGLNGMIGSRRNALTFNPMSKVTAWVPVGHDGGKPAFHNGVGYFGWTSISARAGRDREKVKELLRILDYFASPFGSEEKYFLSNGIEGVHHDIKDGQPVLNDKGKADRGPLTRFTDSVPTLYFPEPGWAEEFQKFTLDCLVNGVDDPTWGYYAPAEAMMGGTLGQFTADMRVDFVTGRRPMSDFDGWLRDWRSRGGDAIRKDYQDAIKTA